MLLLTLMSSENRAAASLAHHSGGYNAIINAMITKAKVLGMTNTRYVEPTGLSISHVSAARDLTKLLIATKQYPLIAQLSTTSERMASFKALTISCRSTTPTIWCTTLTGTSS